MIGQPRRLASLSAASVSAVSPDWLIPMTSVPGGQHRDCGTGTPTRTRPSRGACAISSIMRAPISPACQLVPQAVITIRSMSSSSSSVRHRDPAQPARCPSSSSSRPRITSRSDEGCSLDLLVHVVVVPTLPDRLRRPTRRSGRPRPHRASAPGRRCGIPRWLSTAESPSRSRTTFCVCATTAAASEATRYSSFPPMPSRMGLPFRATTILPGSRSNSPPRSRRSPRSSRARTGHGVLETDRSPGRRGR